MNRQSICRLVMAGALALTVAACSSKKSDSSEAVNEEMRNSHLFEAINSGDMMRTASIADSLALNVDDITNNESVAVLMAYLEVHNKASEANDRRLDLETLRKFVDVYDLSLQRDRDGMQAALAQARQVNPDVDLEVLCREFRAKLAEYDAIQGGDLTNDEPAAADTTAAAVDSMSVRGSEEELPVEMRPAD
ncbi:MAG: hypothetical protein NC187_01760 [Candidatus Amulumruptor caecigallinarius]|nr:hypothetical protein [Candidatus Amulumruptor caecigallinarius]MCM1396202.1 hypothetical protein [Candidatus Amulumruptor caecigallinarius]MCM1453798.1 hypothetical protein [bacterium]